MSNKIKARRGNIEVQRGVMPVPTIAQVKPGAQVSIVLKVDQPTGREVQGRVATVLTSGNHPRGIKVRLDDGRVGRVQRMVGSYSTTTAASTETMTRDDREPGQSSIQQRPQRAAHVYQDVRYDGHLEKPPEQLDLSAYIKPAKQKKRGKAKNLAQVEQQQVLLESTGDAMLDATDVESVSACPVCGEFRGDEVAVAHHVNEHFA